MKVKYANFDLVMHTLISAMINLRKMGRYDLADVVKYIAEELQSSQNELLEDAVPAKEYDLLIRRLEHLLESDFIRSFDEKVIMTGQYKRDIREADTVQEVRAKWGKKDSEGRTPCSRCGWKHPVMDRFARPIADAFCPYCGAKMDGGAE